MAGVVDGAGAARRLERAIEHRQVLFFEPRRPFDGAGAVDAGTVFNSAPYQWYAGDATSAFRAGNAGVLLRVSPGPPSGAIIVNRVELCFSE